MKAFVERAGEARDETQDLAAEIRALRAGLTELRRVVQVQADEPGPRRPPETNPPDA